MSRSLELNTKMSGIVIAQENEDLELVRRLFNSHYKKVHLSFCQDSSSVMDKILNEGPYDFVILDLNSKHFDPIEISTQVIDVLGDRPFLFMGTPSIIKDRLSDETFNSHPCNETLFTPVDPIRFKVAVSKITNTLQEEAEEKSIVEDDIKNYVPIRIKNFYNYKSFDFDVFVQITSDKFMKVINRQEEYPQSLIQSYVKKGVQTLFMRKDEHMKFLIEKGEDCLKKIKLKNLTLKQKLKLQLVAINIIHLYIQSIGFTEIALQLLEYLTEKVESTFEKEGKDIVRILMSVNTSDNTTLNYLRILYLVSYASDAMKWQSPLMRKKLLVASILADSTLINYEMGEIHNISDPRLHQFSNEEIENYKTHLEKEAQLALTFNGIPDLDYIIKHRHELPNGQGMSGKLNAITLPPMVCCFNFCLHFAGLLKNTKLDKVTLKQVMFEMKEDWSQGNFRTLFQQFAKTFKF